MRFDKRICLVMTATLLLAACGGPSAEERRIAAEMEAARINVEKLEAERKAAASMEATISAADKGRVCRAVIGSVMGHDPSIIRVTKVTGNLVKTRYARDDGMVWKNQCRVLAGMVVWSTLDIDGPGTGPGRWRDEDEILYRIESGRKIWIRTTMGGSLIGEETFTVR